jgi:hypothetical protein
VCPNIRFYGVTIRISMKSVQEYPVNNPDSED